MHRKKIIAIIILIVVVIAGGFYYYHTRQASQNKETYTLGTVSAGSISQTIDATGTIEPINSVDLSSRSSGTLEKVYVKENDRVTKGQLLATIESKALQSTLEQAQNTLANNKSYYERLNDLYNEGAVSYQTMDNARLNYLNAEAEYNSAQANVNDTRIYSPMDGYVIGEPMKEGSTVSQGLSSQMVIVTVADLSSMKIELLVDETDIGGVQKGQEVTFTVDAYPDKTFHGVVNEISKKESSSTSSSTSSSSTSSVVYYTVYVMINKDELEGLYPSMTARAEIHGKTHDNALIVPVTALRTDTDGSYVYLKADGTLKKAYVTTGITTDKDIEILSGLSEGDQIVVSGTVAQEKSASSSSSNRRGGPGF